MIMNFMKNRQK